MHERNVLAQNENAFFVKDLRKNYLGKSNGGNCLGSNYLEGHYPGIIIRGQLSRRQLSGGNFSRGHCLGDNYPGRNCPRTLFGAFHET